MIRLAVVSGKGGTGKTVVTAGLAALNETAEILADCDVEAANLEFLVSARQLHAAPFEGAETASIDPGRCWGCGRCAEFCRFGAITVGGDAVAVCEPRDCEGCGLCERVCPSGAVTLVPRISGTVVRSATQYRPLIHARLYPGSGNSGLLVQTVKHQAEAFPGSPDLLLIDGPPGTGCPLISTVSGTDAVVIVTEPSLSGLHDLRRVIGVCRRFEVRIFRRDRPLGPRPRCCGADRGGVRGHGRPGHRADPVRPRRDRVGQGGPADHPDRLPRLAGPGRHLGDAPAGARAGLMGGRPPGIWFSPARRPTLNTVRNQSDMMMMMMIMMMNVFMQSV